MNCELCGLDNHKTTEALINVLCEDGHYRLLCKCCKVKEQPKEEGLKEHIQKARNYLLGNFTTDEIDDIVDAISKGKIIEERKKIRDWLYKELSQEPFMINEFLWEFDKQFPTKQ